jgi:hypothetical protein
MLRRSVSTPVFVLAPALALATACGEGAPVAISAPPAEADADPGAGGPNALDAGDDPLCGPLWADEGNAHVPPGTTVTYHSNPPQSGPHFGQWVASGIYDQAVDPRGYVHNLEHGWVVLLYRSNAPQAQIDILEDFWRNPPADAQCPDAPKPRIIVSPAPDLDRAVALAAWRRGFTANALTRAELEAFFATCREAAPELGVCADGGPAPFLETETTK